MATVLKVYDGFIDRRDRGLLNMGTATVKYMLLGAGYAFSQAHKWRSDLTGEVSGAGYTAGGQIAAVTFNTDAVNHRTETLLAETQWNAAGGSLGAYYAVAYASRGGAASADELIACYYNDEGSGPTLVQATNDIWKIGQQTLHSTNQNA
jgi:hypothetical protein